MASMVVDPSVILKCLLPEADSERALRAVAGAAPVAPDWLAVECAAVLAWRLRQGEIGREAAATAIADLRLLPITWVRDHELVAAAFDIAAEIARPMQDCLYLALANERNLQLLTADRSLLAALDDHPQLFVRVDLLEEVAD